MVPRATLGSVRPRPNPFRNLQQEPPSRWVLYSVVNVRLLIARCILSFVGLHYLFNCQDNNIKCRWVRVMRGNEGSNKFPTLYCVFFKNSPSSQQRLKRVLPDRITPLGVVGLSRSTVIASLLSKGP
jgi:hypothetical protein